MFDGFSTSLGAVIHPTGGLEVSEFDINGDEYVIHPTGGLEDLAPSML